MLEIVSPSAEHKGIGYIIWVLVDILAHVVVAFHVHQSAEKYLKGLLALQHRIEPPKIQNLRLLLAYFA